MKMIIYIGLAVMMILSFVSCGENNDSNKQESDLTASVSETEKGTEEKTTEKASEKVTEVLTETETEKPTESSKDVFTQFEETLNSKGIAYEKTEMAAGMIGAESGTKYKIGDGKVELYKFDISTEAYKSAEKTQKIALEGFGEFKATVKNGYALMLENLDEKQYIEIFNSLTF